MKNQAIINDAGRIFIQRNTDRLATCPEYVGKIGMSGITQARDESLKIRVASDKTNGEYELLQRVPGAIGDVTFDLTTYAGHNGISVLRELFQKPCPVTIHIHYGCNNPQDFYNFTKALIIEDAYINNYSTTEALALTVEQRNAVQETVSVEAKGMYEYYNLKNFTLVADLQTDVATDIFLLGNVGCESVCTFCLDCNVGHCTENFYSIEEGSGYIGAHNDFSRIYTIEDDGLIKLWESTQVINEISSCGVVGTLPLEVGETVISTAFNKSDSNIIIGTDTGNIFFYNTKNGYITLEYQLTGEVATVIKANEYGYLIGTDLGNIFYSVDGGTWSASGSGFGTIRAIWLYDENSWLVSTLSTMHYTNSSGANYNQKSYYFENNDTIKEFEQSNAEILHGISDTYYYQSFDSGCNWRIIDLSKYFSELYSIEVCPNNEFVVYLSGLSVDQTTVYIVSVNFGA